MNIHIWLPNSKSVQGPLEDLGSQYLCDRPLLHPDRDFYVALENDNANF